MGGKRVALWSVASGIGVAVALAASLLTPAQAESVLPGLGPSTKPRPAGTGADAEARVVALAQPGDVQQFWTPARMASATSEDTGKAATAGHLPAAAGSSATAAVAAGTPSIRNSYVNGRPSIGIIFYQGADLKAHYCTAFLVTSASKNLIMMAAHCNPGSWMAFVPGYRDDGKTAAPFGVWPVLKAYKDARFRTTGAGTDYDYAFAKVGKNAAGKQIQDVLHGNTLTITPTYDNATVAVTGYSKVGPAPADRPVTCWAPTRKLAGYTQMVYLCRGFYGGTSGSPWLIGFDPKTNTGKVIGLIGGYEAGGPNSWTSYSPIFTSATVTLYNYAVAH